LRPKLRPNISRPDYSSPDIRPGNCSAEIRSPRSPEIQPEIRRSILARKFGPDLIRLGLF
jgi:hypothetical protein